MLTLGSDILKIYTFCLVCHTRKLNDANTLPTLAAAAATSTSVTV